MIQPDMIRFFLAGYETIRPFSLEEKQMIPLFKMLRQIWDMGDILLFELLWDDQPTAKEKGKQLEKYVRRLHDMTEVFQHHYGLETGSTS